MAGEQPRPARFQAKACGLCGASFRTALPMAKYCSPICRVKADEARRQRAKRQTPPKEEG